MHKCSWRKSKKATTYRHIESNEDTVQLFQQHLTYFGVVGMFGVFSLLNFLSSVQKNFQQ
jgi:hypothetical protein